MTNARQERQPQLQGAMTALVTPFHGGEVDWARLDALIDRQIESGIDWLVPCGTTGESPTLSLDEHQRVIDAVIARSAGRTPVMAGTGTNCTAETIRRTRHAKSGGAAAALVVTPYYNRPSPEGLFRHFAAVAQSVDLPLVLYNVPFRTGISLGNDVVVRLHENYPHIQAIKHATGTVDGVTELLSRCSIRVLSGDDQITWPLIALGATGVISVLSNLCPQLMKSLVRAAQAGEHGVARRIHRQVHDLAVGLARYGPNPVPIKTAMAIAGLLDEEFRLPLCAVDSGAHTGIERLLQESDVLESVLA